MNEEKENIKNKISIIFTKIRNEINRREDEILSEVDNKFKNICFNETIVNESKKLPNAIKRSLDKAQALENLWEEDTKLSFIVNDCIIIEDTYENIKKCLSMKIDINFEPDENSIFDDILLENIEQFGKLNSYEKSYEDIDKVFDNYLEKKLKKGIKNIFAFNIEIDLPIANDYLENCLI